MGCTAAGFLAGPQGDAEFCARLSEASGAPVVSAAGSMVKVLRAKSVRQLAVVSPYGPLVNDALRHFLFSSGFGITRFEGFEVGGIKELLALSARDVADRARRAVTDDSDAVFVACSQLPTYGMLDELENETHRPAWSSVRAIAWNACLTLGVDFGATVGAEFGATQ
jgi:maleate cis-trans isomerase